MLPWERKSSARSAAALSAARPNLATRNSSMLRLRAGPMPVLPGYSVSSRSDQFTEQRNLSDDGNSIVGSDGLHPHTTKKKKGTCGRLDRLVYVPMRRQSKGELTGHWKAMAGEQRGAGDDRVIDDGAEESLPSRGDDVQSERGRIGGESGRLNRARAGGRKEKKEGVDDREFRCVHTHTYM